jgi:hypothetical protein
VPGGDRGVALHGELAAQHRDRAAAEENPFTSDPDVDHPAAGRHLVAHQLALAQARRPERPQAAVGGAGDRVLVHADGGGEEARDEVELGPRRGRGDDHAADCHRAQEREVGADGSHGLLAVKEQEVVKLVTPEVERPRAERLEEGFRRLGGLLGLGGEVQLDEVAAP